ncbi:MAG: hypothetical protein HUU45_15635, partial [Leptospiraceae bacterium]|nr:hypothetical protein [Leptospiraceae bacterium]
GKINRIYSVLYRERRDNVLQLLRQIPEFVKIAHELTTGKSYKVIMPNKDGYLGIRIDGSGFTPNIHGKDGKFIAQASLQEISPDLNNIVNQLANQNAFAEILQRLEVIDQKISEILVNDHGDRIARVNAGINLYHQAILAEPENRPLLLSNTITELQKGLESLVNELRNDIKFIEKLPRGYWSILFSAQTPHKRVDEKIKPMLEAYRAILRSAYFLPIAHEKMGNPKSQEFCLQQLKSVTEEFGQAYEKITCWLSPEDADNLGKTWVTSQQIASGIIPPSRQLGSGDSTDIEFQFTPTEITIA